MADTSETLQALKDKKANAESGCIVFAALSALLLLAAIVGPLIIFGESKLGTNSDAMEITGLAGLALCLVAAGTAAYYRLKAGDYGQKIKTLKPPSDIS